MFLRSSALADAALTKNDGWLRRIGAKPPDGPLCERWIRELRTVVAYRDKYALGPDTLLGDVRSDTQGLDLARAQERSARHARSPPMFHHGLCARTTCGIRKETLLRGEGDFQWRKPFHRPAVIAEVHSSEEHRQ